MTKLRNAAILLGLSAGALFILPQNANATSNVGFPPTPFTGGVTEGQATFTGFSIGLGAGTFTYDSPMADMYTANLNFNPGLNTGGVTQSFTYTLATTDGKIFTAAGLTSQMQAGLPGGNFTKKVCTSGFGTGTCVDFSTLNTASDNADGTLKPLAGFGSTIYVIDTYVTTNGTAQITGLTNSFQTAVPGPLPILGAGAAFGFSRKLRNRIKSVA